MSKPPAPSDLSDKFMLRMPEGLRDRIREAAEANKRSMNAEIIDRIEVSFEQVSPDKVETANEKMEMLARVMDMAIAGIENPKTEADLAYSMKWIEGKLRARSQLWPEEPKTKDGE